MSFKKTFLVKTFHLSSNITTFPSPALSLLRWVLRLCLQRALPKGRLHQDRRAKLEARCQQRDRPCRLEPALHGVHGGVGEHPCRPKRSSWGSGGQGEQRLYQAQAGDGDPQRREASQGGEDPAEQEDCSLLRTSAGRHHRSHQAGLRGREEAVHAGWETGEGMFFFSCFTLWQKSKSKLKNVYEIHPIETRMLWPYVQIYSAASVEEMF